jgi:hypothetical protein
MALAGDNLAEFLRLRRLPVHPAAGAIWWQPEPGVLEPVARHLALDGEQTNIHLLLEFTGAREARFGALHKAGPLWPLREWRAEEPYEDPRVEVHPLTAWQARDCWHSELIGHHAAWNAVGTFTDGRVSAWLVTCEDDGWLYEVAASENGDTDELRRYWQQRIHRLGEYAGMLQGPAHLGFRETAMRQARAARRPVWRKFLGA